MCFLRRPRNLRSAPKRCALHQHKVLQLQVERNEQAEQGAPQGSSHRCCWKPDLLQSSANSIHESPSRNSHLRISLHITKGDPPSFPMLAIPETSTTGLLIKWGVEVNFFPLVAWHSHGSLNPQMCFCKEPSPPAVQTILSESNYHQIRLLAKTLHYLVSRSQGGLAGSKAA